MVESSTLLARQPGALAGAIPAGVFLSRHLAVTRPRAGWEPRLGCGFATWFFPALTAFQVTMKPGQPRHWVRARLRWALSHTRSLLPRPRDCAQLLCRSSRELPAKSRAAWWHGPRLRMNMHEGCQDSLLSGAETSGRYPEVFFAESHWREMRFVQLSAKQEYKRPQMLTC